MSSTEELTVYHSKFIDMDKYESVFQQNIHDIIKEECPWPISYDINCRQPTQFSEFTYTDCLRGFYINTQSIEMNCRLMQEAASVHCDDFTVIKALEAIIGDKYVLKPSDKIEEPYEIGFMIGQNMFDLVSSENVARLAHEKDNFYLKLHPLTEMEYARKVAFHVGWHRIVRNDLSAYELMRHADVVHTSTGSELTMAAVIFGKTIRNISNFFNESGGVYYPIARLLYLSDDPYQTLNNIINCEFSGLLLPGVKDPHQRIVTYYQKAMEIRRRYAHLSSHCKMP